MLEQSAIKESCLVTAKNKLSLIEDGLSESFSKERLAENRPANEQGASLVSQGTELSDAKRTLLKKFLGGRLPASSEQSIRLEARPHNGTAPLSSSQEQVWLHGLMFSDAVPVYNETLTLRRTAAVDVDVLMRTLDEIIRRHEIWRTTFDVVDGQPLQIIHPTFPRFVIPTVDLRNYADGDREAEAVRLAREDAKKPFDLKSGPLMRALLVTLRDNDHRLFLTFHQLIFDGITAYQVLLPELAALYDAFSQGKPSPLPEPQLQYADYANWQREWLKTPAVEKQLNYWEKALAGDLPQLNWPSDPPRPPVQTYRGEIQTAAFSKQLLHKLKAFGESEGATLFMTLVAGLGTLLHRYTGEEDILIGAPTAGRNIPELRGMLGYFINLLPLRLDLSGEPTFRQLLKRVRETVIGALSNQGVPFTQLVEKIGPVSDPSRNPLFQIALSLNPPAPALAYGWTATQSDIPTGASKIDLYIDVDEKADGIAGPITYNPDLFKRSTIVRMIGHWSRLLEQAATTPDQKVTALRLLTEDEQQQFLTWNDTRSELPGKCTHELFVEQCERTPDSVAVEFGDARLTYRELNARANQLGHYLRKKGVGPGKLVALCADRGLDMVVGLLGILKAGGAYIPLDPGFPKERLAAMLDDAKPFLLITQEHRGGMLPSAKDLLLIDAEWDRIAKEENTEPAVNAAADDLAYVIYTSGSTGKPKGVQIEHKSLANLLLSMRHELNFNAADTLVAVTTLSFDIAGLELYLPLLCGAKLVIASPEQAQDGALLRELIERYRATTMQATPTSWRLLIEAGWQGGPLSKVLCGGEAMPPELGRDLSARAASVWNVYGPTETTIWSSIYKLTGQESDSVPIGTPVANTQIYVLDRHQRPVPVNTVGEIYIGGDGVARGYLNRKELNAEKFVRDPFGLNPDGRLYRTGDLGRYRDDGNIECLGRNDQQVKIRGFRIELGEIESVVSEHGAVRQCAVIARGNIADDKRLIAFFEPAAGCSATASEIREHLRHRLPEYMIPASIVAIDNMPLTPNGKIDRKALPATDTQASPGETLAPRDEIEQVLARLWSRVLGVPAIGVEDNFFELGGHSLLAVRIIAGIEKVFGKRLPLATLVLAPTVARLADVLRRENWTPSWSSLVPMRAGGSKPPLFLIHAHGGNVLEYQPLVKQLEADQPVYALQARSLDGSICEGHTLEEMAAAYLQEIRSLQPGGPYFLGGFCFGGLVALEAAQQLLAAGEQVGLLVLIQTMNPEVARFAPNVGLLRQWWYRTTKRFDLERDNFSARGIGYFGDRCRDLADVLQARGAIALDTMTGNVHSGKRSLRYILESLRIEHAKAYAKYQMRPYPGDTLLLRASKQLSGLMIDETSGWKSAVRGKLEVREIQGHQQTMLQEPNVSDVAQILTERLQAAQTARGNSKTAAAQ